MNLRSNFKLFKSFIIVTLTFSFIGFWGCEKDNLFENAYSESGFLELSVENELINMSFEDMQVLSEALSRLNIYKKNGYYKIKQESGIQVNISEDLFNIIKNLYAHTNSTFNQKKSSYSIPRLKSGDPEEEEKISSADCMAHSISYAGGGSYGNVGSYLISQYGLGVPASSFYDACHHFFPDGDTINIGSVSHGTMDNQIIIFQTGPNIGHAVNGQWYDINSGTIMYWDEQNEEQGFIHKSDIMYIYQK